MDPAYLAQASDGKKRSMPVHKSLRGGLYLAVNLLEKLKVKKRHRMEKMWLGKGVPKEVEYTEINCNTLIQEYSLGFIERKGEIGGYDENEFEEMTK